MCWHPKRIAVTQPWTSTQIISFWWMRVQDTKQRLNDSIWMEVFIYSPYRCAKLSFLYQNKGKTLDRHCDIFLLFKKIYSFFPRSAIVVKPVRAVHPFTEWTQKKCRYRSWFCCYYSLHDSITGHYIWFNSVGRCCWCVICMTRGTFLQSV